MIIINEFILCSDDKEFALHFSECEEETIYLTENEVEEWVDYLIELLTDYSVPLCDRLQQVVDNITAQ